MRKSEIEIILQSIESQADCFLQPKEKQIALAAMVKYGERAIENYRKNENQAIKLEAVKLFPALFAGQFKMWLRKQSFLIAKRKAIRRSKIENKKIYVIRQSEIGYVLLSTSDVKHGKKINVFNRKVGAIELTEAADFIAYPPKI